MTARLTCAGLCAVLALGCTLDLSHKHDCAVDADCIGGHVCLARTCVAPDATDAANASANVAFVTSATTSSAFQSLDAADQICAGAASAAHLSGTFRAWLSTSTTDARDRLQGARGWIRADGAPFADTVEDIAEGRIFNPLSVDEHGAPTSDLAITGTTVDGRNNLAFDCNDWSNGATGKAVVGTTNGTTGVWTYFSTISCGEPARLYCFGVDNVTTVAPPPPHGKLAFLSDDPFMVGGGLAAADAQCQSEAGAAHLPGTFRALLASAGVTAAARVQANLGVVWSRVDGVALNAPGATSFFEATTMLAPLNVTSQLRYMDTTVFTGATGPNVPANDAQTCGNWVAGSSATVGRANYVPWWFATGGLEPCGSNAVSIYCFQSD